MRQVSIGSPDVTSRYFKDLRRIKPLSPEKQLELLKEYASSNDEKRKNEIKKQLVLSNQLFIVSIARHLAVEDDFNDLISEGNIGMIRAIEKFEPNKGNKFLTYAAHHIRKAMVDYISDTKNMVSPKNVCRVYAYSESAKNKFFVTNGRYPSIDELCEELERKGVVFSNKEDLYDIKVSSMDAGFDPYETEPIECNWVDKYCYDNNNESKQDSNITEHINKMTVKQMVNNSLSCLTDEERKIVCEYYGIGCKQKTPYDIAKEIGVKPKDEIIERRINKYIKKIRKWQNLD